MHSTLFASEDAVEHDELDVFLRRHEEWSPMADEVQSMPEAKPVGVPGAMSPLEMTPERLKKKILATPPHSPLKGKNLPVNKRTDELDIGDDLGHGLDGVRVTEDELRVLMKELGLGGADAGDLVKASSETSSMGKQKATGLDTPQTPDRKDTKRNAQPLKATKAAPKTEPTSETRLSNETTRVELKSAGAKQKIPETSDNKAATKDTQPTRDTRVSSEAESAVKATEPTNTMDSAKEVQPAKEAQSTQLAKRAQLMLATRPKEARSAKEPQLAKGVQLVQEPGVQANSTPLPTEIQLPTEANCAIETQSPKEFHLAHEAQLKGTQSPKEDSMSVECDGVDKTHSTLLSKEARSPRESQRGKVAQEEDWVSRAPSSKRVHSVKQARSPREWTNVAQDVNRENGPLSSKRVHSELPREAQETQETKLENGVQSPKEAQSSKEAQWTAEEAQLMKAALTKESDFAKNACCVIC